MPFYLGFCRSINFTSHIARSIAHACNSKTKVSKVGAKFFSEYSPIDSGDLKERFRP